MDIYDMLMKPLEAGLFGKIRSEIIPLAHGQVLEVAIGTGANLPYYNLEKIISFTGSDKERSKTLDIKARDILGDTFTFVQAPLEELPFPPASFDTVVTTLALCTANTQKSLREIRRMLKPGGFFIFMEHIKPKGKWGTLAEKLDRLWPKMANGCHLSRHTDEILRESGFTNLNINYAGSGVICYGLAVNP